jgi:hypothetical protein
MTKDNLTRQHWTGSTKCIFCCRRRYNTCFLLSAKFLWWVLQVTFGLQDSNSINDMFINLLLQLGRKGNKY